MRSKLIPKWNENPRLTIWRNLVRQFSIFAYIADFEVSRSTLWVFLTHPLSLSSSWLNLQNRIDYGLNFTLLPKVGWNIQNSFKNANKKKIPLDIVFVNNFCGSGELGRRANVSKLKNHAKYGNCQNIFLTYHFCDNYPVAQKFFAFIVNRLLFVLIIFGAHICSVELPDISWIDFGKWATFQKRKWFSFKRCHQAPISKWVCHWHSFIKKCKDIVFTLQ